MIFAQGFDKNTKPWAIFMECWGKFTEISGKIPQHSGKIMQIFNI
jgi:hypothetical protein